MSGTHKEGLKVEEPYYLDITSRIIEANKAISHNLVEGGVAPSKKRNAMKCSNGSCKWPKSSSGLVEVPYIFSDYFYDAEKASIKEAMDTRKPAFALFLIVANLTTSALRVKWGTCWATIGRDGGRQLVSLSVYGCLDRGTIQHKLLHTLGFHPEHTRSDIDRYVRISWQNVPSASANNFNQMNTNNLNTPYDYSSVMHYGRSFFASSFGADTIAPIPDSSVPIGQRNGMSYLDILRINRLYKCK
ncbi:hypothetical protein JOQ06_008298 [Pogonophryne albipinna]|uniref:Metalloendopeptidase n=1 Tax=Pogonophryne albipinna TaxID=1090488 RepID=A0AAD6F9X6_9TELE|nr:hypothetical protein JOQ06_008298 [Pogonophryne albipinna]